MGIVVLTKAQSIKFHEVLGRLVTDEGVVPEGYRDDHTVRVADFSFRTGLAMGLPEHECLIRVPAFFLHDWGKADPEIACLLPLPKVTPKQKEKISEHTWRGAMQAQKRLPQIFKNDGRAMREIIGVQLFHHKNYSGFFLTELERSLYYGTNQVETLCGKSIPVAARIVAVTDHYDAMVGGKKPRSYQKRKFTPKEAIGDLVKKICVKFDPEIVRVFVEQVLGESFTRQSTHRRNKKRLTKSPVPKK